MISQVMQDAAQNSPKSILSDKACISRQRFDVDPVPLNSFSAMPNDLEICSYSAVKSTVAGKCLVRACWLGSALPEAGPTINK